MPAVVVGLRRAPAGARLPWWLQLAALTSYNIGNIWWIWLVSVLGRTTGDDSYSALFTSCGHLLVLVAPSEPSRSAP
jgi:hypothetical protein